MFIIYVSSYKKKIAVSGIIFLLWVFMFFAADFIVNNSLIFKVTINNCLSFSYPYSIQLDGIYLKDRLESNAIEANSSYRKPIAQKFTNYNSLKGKFSFNYPSAFTIQQKDFPGSDILYHIDFHNAEKTAHGFVQVWNLPYPLKDFLEQSKSVSKQNFKSFVSKPIYVNNEPGYLWDYVVKVKDGTYYKGMEVFFQKDGRMYRISYFIPAKLWNKTQSKIFWNMVYSFKTY